MRHVRGYNPQIKPAAWVCNSDNVKRQHDKRGLPHPALYIPFWENSGNTVYDLSGNFANGAVGTSMGWSVAPTGVGLQAGTTYNDANNVINLGTILDPTVGPWPGITIFWLGIIGTTSSSPAICINAANGEYYDNWDLSYEFVSGPTWKIQWRPGQNSSGILYNTNSLAGQNRSIAATWIKSSTAVIYLDGINVADGTLNVNWDASNYTSFINGYYRSTWRTSAHQYQILSIYKESISQNQVQIIDNDPHFALYPINFFPRIV